MVSVGLGPRAPLTRTTAPGAPDAAPTPVALEPGAYEVTSKRVEASPARASGPAAAGSWVGRTLRKFSRAVAGVMIGAMLVGTPLVARADPTTTNASPERPVAAAVMTREEARPTTETRPLSVDVGLGFPDGARAGVDYNLNRYLSLGGNAGTLGLWNDYGVHARLYPIGTRRFHPYLEAGTHFMDIKDGGGLAVIPQARLGLEFRGDSGFTFRADGGAGAPVTGVSRAPIPVFGLSVGYSF